MGPEQFKQLVLEQKDRLHTYSAWLLGHREDARDVVQETLMRTWVNRHGIQLDAAPAWMMRTAHHQCVDRLRQRGRRAARRPELLQRLDRTPIAPGPADAAHRDESLEALARALDTLPFRDRSLVLLRDGQGLSYDEMSRVLETPVGTLKAAVHRARLRVREQLDILGARETCS